MMKTFDIAELAGLVGRDLGMSGWLHIDQLRVDEFARVTGDDQWIHIDPARAAPFGGTVAHGFLVLSLIPLLKSDIYAITGATRTVNYGIDKVRFVAPVPVGSSIRLRQSLSGCGRRGDAVQVTTRSIVEVGDDAAARPACVAETIVLLFPG